ncbi:hypothetical protein GUJ93_ZPchr0014g47072 [Zizania palustris]|uniref:RRM domain-containing protein n=1 Tax=Zizania palustris TaxID=103762 RepID=A0A8J5TKX4_ZIZPA|nr:hypothetical protein GUJ93_ZPchr0014g47072 [Zizania palustris]
MDGGERTFKANFTVEGVALLQQRVKEKLKELMGDYSDDTLAEYVVVLLRNGRRRDEAAKELEVFLSDNNDAFVSWLWDHLSTSLHLYVQPKAISTNDEAKSIQSNARGMSVHNMTSSTQAIPERVVGIQKTKEIRQRREWGGIIREQPAAVPLRSVVATVSHAEEKTVHKSHAIRRTHSPETHHYRKRIREDDARQIKRTSHQAIDAPRRLLQFAVRDAVKTVHPVTPRSESASKRLRSVVSTMVSDSPLDVKLQKMDSVVRVPGATAALRAAAEAAEDVLKERYSGSVFKRLGRGGMVNDAEESFGFREQDPEREYDGIDNIQAESRLDFHERSYVGDANMCDQETIEAADSATDIDGYDNTGAAVYNGLGSNQSTVPSSVSNESLVAEFNIIEGAAALRSRKLIPQDTHPSSGQRLSGRILNIPVSSTTRKPANHETARNVLTLEPHVPKEMKGTISRKSNVTPPHANYKHMTDKSKDLMCSTSTSMLDAQKVSSLAVGSYTAGQPEGSTDSRTVFVSNVHFAATKDALSRHFNKFGAVLKTLIVTDISGQPTGSAYIEFSQKESAEQALTLNGTSFMSRILKVVKRNSLEVPQLPGWSCASRGSTFASRLTRTAYPRPAFPGAIRGRLLRGGARSLQWKRDSADSVDAGKPSHSTPIHTGSFPLVMMCLTVP